jgi:hypothetical protein
MARWTNDHKSLQGQYEKIAEDAKKLRGENVTLQATIRTLLPREGILEDYQRNVRTTSFAHSDSALNWYG